MKNKKNRKHIFKQTKIENFCKVNENGFFSKKIEEKKTNEKVPFWVHWLNYQDSTKKGGEKIKI